MFSISNTLSVRILGHIIPNFNSKTKLVASSDCLGCSNTCKTGCDGDCKFNCGDTCKGTNIDYNKGF